MEDLDIVIQRRNGVYFAGIPAIGLYARADTSVRRSTGSKTENGSSSPALRSRHHDDFKPRAPVRPVFDDFRSIAGFAIKTGLFVCLVAGAVIFTTYATASSIERVMDRIHATVQHYASIGGREFWSKARLEIARAAAPDNDLTEPEKRKLIVDLETLSARWRPFINAIISPEPAKPPDRGANSGNQQ